jgi:hypothetical protein
MQFNGDIVVVLAVDREVSKDLKVLSTGSIARR